jgi:putative hemolysin
MKNQKLVIRVGILIVVIALVVFAISQSRNTSEPENSDNNVQIANPASVYCVEQGGTVDIRTDADGNQYGMCILADGTEIEEWELFRSQQPDSDTP